MSIGDDLNTYLRGITAVAALVGTRINPDKPKEGADFPRIVFTCTKDVPFYAMEGECGLAEAEYEIECQDETYTGAKNLRDVLKPFLSGFQGVMGSRWVSSCFVTDDYDHPSPRIHGDEKGVLSKAIEIRMQYGTQAR